MRRPTTTAPPAPSTGPTARTDVADGARAMTAVILGLVPAGVAVGAAWAAADLPRGPGLLAAATVYGASAQLALTDLTARGASGALVALTLTVMSLRLALLGVGLGRHLRGARPPTRGLAALLLVDPAYLVADARFTPPTTPAQRRRFYLGAAGSLWLAWQAAHATGLLLGATIPRGASLDLALPLTLLALLAPRLRDATARRAAIVAAAVALAASTLPLGTGLLVAVVAGTAATHRPAVRQRASTRGDDPR